MKRRDIIKSKVRGKLETTRKNARKASKVNKSQIATLFFVSLFVVGLASIPLLPLTQSENITDQGLFSNDFGTEQANPELTPWDPFLEPYNYTKIFLESAEGTPSPDSITEFKETTDDDVLFMPDGISKTVTVLASFGSAGPDGSLNTYTATQDKDGTAYRGYDGSSPWNAYVYELVFDIDNYYSGDRQGEITSADVAIYGYCDVSAYNSYFKIYDFDALVWFNYDSIQYEASYSWKNYTITDAKYFNDGIMWIGIGDGCEYAYVDYAEIQMTFEYATLADADHYAETFADVSDWGILLGNTITTDGDVATFTTEGDNAYKIYYDNTPSESWGGRYVEVRISLNDSTDDTAAVVLKTGDNYGGSTIAAKYIFFSTTTYQTVKFYVASSSVVESIAFIIRGASVPIEYYIDYLRGAPATQMGWQHDGSTTEGTTNSASMAVSSDGDELTFTTSASVQSMSVHFDTTTTTAVGSTTYYPFVEYSITTLADGGSDGNVWALNIYDSAGSYEASGYSDGSGIYRINVAAASIIDVEYFKFYLQDSGDSAKLDYVKLYSIANFTYDDGGSESSNDYSYVSSGNLVVNTDVYTKWNYDPTLSISIGTYNVWNASVNDATGFRFRELGDTNTLYAQGETRGALVGTTLTDFDILLYANIVISAIEFWEDSTAPVVQEKWNTPNDPDTADDVVIKAVTTDVVGCYEVTATALSEPSGSSLSTQSLTLQDTNPSGAELWTVTIDSSNLIAGEYVFEIEASDGANSDYEYLSFTVVEDSYTGYIRIFDSLGDFIDYETFEVYVNSTRQYTDSFSATTSNAYEIQVKDRWGSTLNTTIFSAGTEEFVVTVNVYSLKVMSWHDDFVRFNITRSGITYSEIITPLEIVNFRLYSNSYTYAIDYLNGSSLGGNINLTNSTALIVSGNTISDVLGIANTIHTMTNSINITTTTISNEVVTIQLMFDWTNTSLYNQTINIIAAFDWTNTTLYNQTITIANLFDSTNTVLYDQIILIQNMFNWQNTTIYNQTVSILNSISSTNATLYTQTVSILSQISSVNSTLYAQTVSVLTNIQNMNSTLYYQTISILANITNVNTTIYSQTISILANIANLDSDIQAQTVTLLAEIQSVNSTIYSQTVSILSQISSVNSTLYSQTVSILSQISSVNSTLYTQTVSILSQIANLDSDIQAQTISLLSEIQSVNSTIYSQTVSILSQISSVNSTLYSQTVSVLSNIQTMNSTIYNQTISILANITNVNTTIYSQTISILANIANLDSDIQAQTVSLLAEIQSVNSTIYNQTVSLLSSISNTNATIYNQTITLMTAITSVNSTLYSQTVTILSQLQTINSTLYSQTVTILNEIQSMNSTLYNQTIYVMNLISDMNSTIFNRTITILNEIYSVNRTLYYQTINILAETDDIDAELDAAAELLDDIDNKPPPAIPDIDIPTPIVTIEDDLEMNALLVILAIIFGAVLLGGLITYVKILGVEVISTSLNKIKS